MATITFVERRAKEILAESRLVVFTLSAWCSELKWADIAAFVTNVQPMEEE